MASRGTSPLNKNGAFEDTPPKWTSQALYGRSSRDMDEEIIKLRNENFNLKLRLHFKDQVNEDGTRSICSGESFVKELEDAKAIINALRLEVNEKTQLLKEAAVAIAEHEDNEREFVIENQAKIAELEGYIAHLQTENPLENIFAQDIKRMEEKATRQTDELHKAKRQIEHLTRELAECKNKSQCCEVKLREICTENSEMMSLLQQHYNFSLLANRMMEIQKRELDECLVEKLAFVRKISDILPELNCQNELLKEATITVQNILDTTDLKENFSLNLLANYKAAIIESKSEIHSITEDIVKWMQARGMDLNFNAESSSSSSQINSDVSSQDLSDFHAGDLTLLPKSEPEPVAEHGKSESHKVRSSGKHLRSHAKKSFTGLRQFVKCWGRQYPK